MNPRWFVDFPVDVGQVIDMTGDAGHHYARVLRVSAGEHVPVASRGQAYLAVAEAVDAKQGIVRLRVEQSVPRHDPATRVYLVQGLAKGDKIDAILQHNTEAGAAGFLLHATRRSVVRLDRKKAEEKQRRWQKVVAEAASQSQRDHIPPVAYAGTFTEAEAWWEALQPDLVLFLDEDEGDNGLQSVLRRSGAASGSTIVVVVGPEGGWDDSERDTWVRRIGAVRTTLGGRILRTESAGLAAVAAVLYEYGDLGG